MAYPPDTLTKKKMQKWNFNFMRIAISIALLFAFCLMLAKEWWGALVVVLFGLGVIIRYNWFAKKRPFWNWGGD